MCGTDQTAVLSRTIPYYENVFLSCFDGKSGDQSVTV